MHTMASLLLSKQPRSSFSAPAVLPPSRNFCGIGNVRASPPGPRERALLKLGRNVTLHPEPRFRLEKSLNHAVRSCKLGWRADPITRKVRARCSPPEASGHSDLRCGTQIALGSA